MYLDSEQAVKAAACYVQTQRGQGTGFLVSGEGHVVTNHHVIAGETQVGVRFTHDAGYRQAHVVRQEPTYDFAMLVTTTPVGIQPLHLAIAAEVLKIPISALGQGPDILPTPNSGDYDIPGIFPTASGGDYNDIPGIFPTPNSGDYNDIPGILPTPRNRSDHSGVTRTPRNRGTQTRRNRDDDFGIVPTANASYAQIWRSFTATIPGRLLTTSFLSGVGLAVLWLIAWSYLAPGVEWLSGEQAVLVVFITGAVGGVALFRNWIFKRKPNRRR